MLPGAPAGPAMGAAHLASAWSAGFGLLQRLSHLHALTSHDRCRPGLTVCINIWLTRPPSAGGLCLTPTTSTSGRSGGSTWSTRSGAPRPRATAAAPAAVLSLVFVHPNRRRCPPPPPPASAQSDVRCSLTPRPPAQPCVGVQRRGVDPVRALPACPLLCELKHRERAAPLQGRKHKPGSGAACSSRLACISATHCSVLHAHGGMSAAARPPPRTLLRRCGWAASPSWRRCWLRTRWK